MFRLSAILKEMWSCLGSFFVPVSLRLSYPTQRHQGKKVEWKGTQSQQAPWSRKPFRHVLVALLPPPRDWSSQRSQEGETTVLRPQQEIPSGLTLSSHLYSLRQPKQRPVGAPATPGNHSGQNCTTKPPNIQPPLEPQLTKGGQN